MMTDPSLFESLCLSPSLTQVLKELGFEKLTAVQAKSIPLLLEGRDLIGQSKTGSGKTAAFTLPILQKWINEAESRTGAARHAPVRAIQALVLCPTRELCTQVAREMRKLGRKQAGLQVLILSGGQPLYPQLTALERGVHIVVGTPGRVLDHLNRRTLDLRRVTTLVLDEADRMLAMGFQEDMEKIFSLLPENRQTAFFSATFPRSIESMSRAFQNNPARVTIEPESASAPDIEQLLIEAPEDGKLDCLIATLEQKQPESAIVFCNLKATVKEIARALSQAGMSAADIHGDLEQFDRDRVMAKFRNQSVRVLVATDVAARGIDIEKLDLVVNFDLPSDPEVYIHRIGRTGRAGQKGLAISLVSPREKNKVRRIEEFTSAPLRPIKLTEPALKKSSQKTGEDDKAVVNSKKDPKMATLIISGGRKDKMRPGDILGALTGEAGGLSATDVGKIEIHDRFSYVAVTHSIAPMAVQRLIDGRIKGRKFRVELLR